MSAVVFGVAAAAGAGEVKFATDPESGFTIYTAKQGSTVIRMAPDAGANVFSIKYKDTELLKQPKSLKELPGFVYGTPIIYPMPNRVRDGVFTFGGKQYKFEPNNNGNFLHGLVHNVPWKVTEVSTGLDHATIRCAYEFAADTEAFKLFPHAHTVRLEVRVTDNAVRFGYTVDNTQSKQPTPFGLALHPWFLYQGSRKETYLTVPATHLMEPDKLLPTGKLLELTGTKLDARQPTSLEGFVIDDVYFGLKPSDPTVIDFRERRLRITLDASEDFTHLVVYTPENEPWFCVENQTCSTDAHNLHAQGFEKEAHLIVVEPGATFSGHAEFRLANY